MTGLDLEPYLRLLGADLGVWLVAVAIALLLALMTWTNWGSRRALGKCLGLSIAVHAGLVGYGYLHPSVLLGREAPKVDIAEEEGIREIRVIPRVEPSAPEDGRPSDVGRPGRRLADWDRPREALALADRLLRPERAAVPGAAPEPRKADGPAPEPAAAELNGPEPAAPESRPEPAKAEEPAPEPAKAIPAEADEVAAAPEGAEPEAPAMPSLPGDERRRPIRPGAIAKADVAVPSRVDGPAIPPALAPEPNPEPPAAELADRGAPELIAPAGAAPAPVPAQAPAPVADAADATGPIPGEEAASPAPAEGPVAASEPARPEADVRRRSRPTPSAGPRGSSRAPSRPPQASEAIALADLALPGNAAMPEPRGEISGVRPLAEVPEVYRSRLDPNRSARAQRSGASAASEQAVERALVWLAKHQDDDGRWDGKVGKLADGTPIEGDDDFTVHCPPGDPCPGECFYWEADTALTGLALLAYLGAGYTHQEGPHADTVARGLNFLARAQKPDGDLRGESRAVGMYCHAMASLALCEAYALTGDPRLKGPASRAVAFLVRAQAPDGRGWRYAPRAPMGDTSILGWAVLVLKSAGYGGLTVPPAALAGSVAWLDRVADGAAGGLSTYQPGKPVKESMTAEAWACRLFLGAGGRGADGEEAAAYLMARKPDRDAAFNLYYWYYGTLAMYLHGGPDWPGWNVAVRDELVRRQQTRGHRSGSWDPDESPEGNRGGRIYSTALAALTLEVYYRYLRVYGESRPAPGPKGAAEGPSGKGWRKAEKGLGDGPPIR